MVNQPNLKTDFDYFLEQKKALIQNPEYYGKFIAIKNKEIIESGFNKQELINKLLEKGLKIGEFIVQHVIENDDVVQRFCSRID